MQASPQPYTAAGALDAGGHAAAGRLGFGRHLACFVLLLGFAMCVAPRCRAQTEPYPEGTVRIVLRGGEQVVGLVLREDAQEVEVEKVSGVRMIIPRSQIISMRSVAGERFEIRDPNRTRLLFAPTARAVGSGQGYLAIYEIFFPFAAVGIANVVTLAGGITVNPGSDRFAYLAPKVTVYQQPDMAFAVGGIGVTTFNSGAEASLFYAVATLGRPEHAVTAGVAYGYSDGDVGDSPVLLIGGELQVSNRVKVLTENYVITGSGGDTLLSLGLRLMGDRVAGDFGFITTSSVLGDTGGFPFLPWLGFAYNFGS